MGLINPLGTAIALDPFGKQAGLASALLGFLQMGCAAIGASIASVLPFQPFASLAVILTAGSALALLVFLPVALPRPKRKWRLERGRDAAKRIVSLRMRRKAAHYELRHSHRYEVTKHLLLAFARR